jgi:hypothetical protein
VPSDDREAPPPTRPHLTGPALQARSVVLGDKERFVHESSSALAYTRVAWAFSQNTNLALSDLSGAVRDECRTYCEQQHGGSYGTVYATAWRNAAAQLHPATSRPWVSTSSSWAELSAALKAHWGDSEKGTRVQCELLRMRPYTERTR